MAQKLLMIALSPTMTEGRIAAWRKKEGDSFTSGDVLCEIETDKASMDYEAPTSGTILKIVLSAGGKATVGDMIAVVGKPGEDFADLLSSPVAATGAAPAPAPGATPVTAPAAAPAAAAPEATPSAATPIAAPRGALPSAPAGQAPASPLARKIARDLGVDLRAVRGTGPGGRIVEKDVRSFAAEPAKPALPRGTAGGGSASFSRAEARIEPVGAKRAVIARRLGESFFSAPHYYLKKEIKVDALIALRKRLNQGREKSLSLNAILMKVSAAVLARHPEINVAWRAEGIESRSVIDIGLAVALPDGLITPVVRDADRKGIETIDAELAALIDKAKTRGLAPDEYEGAGFTITNLGSFGVDEFTAIINPPGSAILAIGAARKTPVVNEEGAIVVATTMVLTLGCDHRTIDGATGAAFLADLAAAIEEPARALL